MNVFRKIDPLLSMAFGDIEIGRPYVIKEDYDEEIEDLYIKMSGSSSVKIKNGPNVIVSGPFYLENYDKVVVYPVDVSITYNAKTA